MAAKKTIATDKREVAKQGDAILLDEDTRAKVREVLDVANTQISRTREVCEERLGLIAVTYKNAKGMKDQYNYNADYTMLEKIKKEE